MSDIRSCGFQALLLFRVRPIFVVTESSRGRDAQRPPQNVQTQDASPKKDLSRMITARESKIR